MADLPATCDLIAVESGAGAKHARVPDLAGRAVFGPWAASISMAAIRGTDCPGVGDVIGSRMVFAHFAALDAAAQASNMEEQTHGF